MAFAKLQIQPQRLLTAQQAGEYLAYPALLEKMRVAGWIKPSISTRKMCAFDVRLLDHCCDRLAAGEPLPGL